MKKSSGFFLIFVLFVSLFFTLSYADSLPSPPNDSWLNLPSPNYLSNDISMFNYNNGILQLGVEHSQLFGFIVNSKVTSKLGSRNGMALEWDYGAYANRLAATWGALVTPSQLIKFTAERLTQQLEFDFISGTVNQRIPQYAYGGTYEFLFPSWINDINFNAYYADAQSKFLPPVTFFTQSAEYIDFRHIAGGTSEGVSVGTDVQPWSTAALGLALNYDQVQYNPVYQLQGTSANNENIGGTIEFQQLLLKNFKFDLLGSKRQIYDEYAAGISWLSPPVIGTQPELGFSVDRIISHTSTPSDLVYRVGMNINFDQPKPPGAQYYSRPSYAPGHDIVRWVDVPAVHMQQVLATADELLQRVRLIVSVISVSPSSGTVSGGTAVTITGTNFTGATGVTFGGLPGINVVVVNDTTITVLTPPHAAGAVDVSVTTPQGTGTLTNGYTYVIPAPTVLNVSPPSGGTGGGTLVSITGTHFTGATGVTIGGSPGIAVTVVNDNTITCFTPPHAAGAVNVSVTTPAGTGTLTNGYTYV